MATVSVLESQFYVNDSICVTKATLKLPDGVKVIACSCGDCEPLNQRQHPKPCRRKRRRKTSGL